MLDFQSMRPFYRAVNTAPIGTTIVTTAAPSTTIIARFGIAKASFARRLNTTSTPLHSPNHFLPHQPPTRRLFRSNSSRSNNSIFTHPTNRQRSAIDPITIFVAVSLTLGTGYLANTYLYSSGKPVDTDEDISAPLETTSTAAYPDMPTQTPPGRPGNLTPEQTQRLKEFWIATFDVFGVDSASSDAQSVTASGASTPDTSAPASGDKQKKRLGLFKKKDKSAASEADAAAADNSSNDKHGLNKDFKEALASTSPEQLRQTFWAMVKHDDPDALLLRFLRARKWDVHNALVMLIATMHWRSTEQKVDTDIMLNGEEAAFKKASSDKDSADFLQQLRMGKSVLHGVDKEGRPIVMVRVRLHKAGEQTEKSLERYTVYTIETCRMMLRGAVDTATIVFDMSGFSMANMVSQALTRIVNTRPDCFTDHLAFRTTLL